MKAPTISNKLSFSPNHSGIYPPLGFVPVADAALGNGDQFGLYWSYGREDQPPLVCDMIHDESVLIPAFSSVDVFCGWVEENDHERGDEVGDPAAPQVRFHQAKQFFASDPGTAVQKLQEVCEVFPESAEYWFSLATQRRRIGNALGAVQAGIRAVASNWVFGRPPQGAIRLLQWARTQDILPDDPLVQLTGQHGLSFGGTKENEIYLAMGTCIESYLDSDTPVTGLLMNQNFAYMMSRETVSFQERYGFNADAWLDRQTGLCEQYLGDSRLTITFAD